MSEFDGDVKHAIESFVNFISPSEEELLIVLDKIKNKKELNGSDIILLKKIKLLNFIVMCKGVKI